METMNERAKIYKTNLTSDRLFAGKMVSVWLAEQLGDFCDELISEPNQDMNGIWYRHIFHIDKSYSDGVLRIGDITPETAPFPGNGDRINLFRHDIMYKAMPSVDYFVPGNILKPGQYLSKYNRPPKVLSKQKSSVEVFKMPLPEGLTHKGKPYIMGSRMKSDEEMKPFVFMDWLADNGFKLCKMYNSQTFDYDKDIFGKRIVVGFNNRHNQEELRVDIGSTNPRVASSYNLVQPTSETEALLFFRFHGIDLS